MSLIANIILGWPGKGKNKKLHVTRGPVCSDHLALQTRSCTLNSAVRNNKRLFPQTKWDRSDQNERLFGADAFELL